MRTRQAAPPPHALLVGSRQPPGSSRPGSPTTPARTRMASFPGMGLGTAFREGGWVTRGDEKAGARFWFPLPNPPDLFLLNQKSHVASL